MQKSGRDAFVNNHQMPPFEKSDWKGNPDMSLESKYAYYDEAFAASGEFLPEFNEKLKELEGMIHSESSSGTETIPNQGLRALIIQHTCRGTFSAVSKTIFANKYSFCNIFQDLHDLQTFFRDAG